MIGHSGRWHRNSFTETFWFFTVTTSSRPTRWNSSKTSRRRVARRSPRDMSSPIIAGPITESLSSRWSSIGLKRYPVLTDYENSPRQGVWSRVIGFGRRAVAPLAAQSPSIGRMTFAGLPPTRVFGGTSLVTTEPAATTEFSPTVTPPMMIAPAAIHTFFSIRIGFPIVVVRRCEGARGCPEVMMFL